MSKTIGEPEPSEKRQSAPPQPAWLLPVKIASVVMGIMIILGVVVLVVTVAMRLSGDDAASEVATSQAPAATVTAAPIDLGEIELVLPPRSRVTDMALDGDRLVLHLQMVGGERGLMIVDLRTGKSRGLIRLVPSEPPK